LLMLNGKNVFVSILALFFILTLTGTCFAAWTTKDLDAEKIAVTFEREVARGGYKIVSTPELKDWIDQKKAMILVDTMPSKNYKDIRIPGAVNFELPIPEMTQMDDRTKAEFVKLLGRDKNRLIVFYCGFTQCTRSHNGAMWAVKLGYKNVYRQPGGIRAWEQADYPVEKDK
jgi:thiosulfate/3-mercaptopyruvate sulfurtransferase